MCCIRIDVESISPLSFALQGNYPNPFNPATTITFSLPSHGCVNLDVYNTAGQKVHELVSDSRAPGIHSVVWDGRDESGLPVSSGVYIARLRMGDFMASRMIMLVK